MSDLREALTEQTALLERWLGIGQIGSMSTDEATAALVASARVSRAALLREAPADQIKKVIEGLVRAVWNWGEGCGVDGVGFDEQGDSHNQWQRSDAMKAKDEAYSLIAALSAAPAQATRVSAHQVPALVSKTQHDGGVVELRFVNERAAEAFMQQYECTVDEAPTQAEPAQEMTDESIERAHRYASEGRYLKAYRELLTAIAAERASRLPEMSDGDWPPMPDRGGGFTGSFANAKEYRAGQVAAVEKYKALVRKKT